MAAGTYAFLFIFYQLDNDSRNDSNKDNKRYYRNIIRSYKFKHSLPSFLFCKKMVFVVLILSKKEIAHTCQSNNSGNQSDNMALIIAREQTAELINHK